MHADTPAAKEAAIAIFQEEHHSLAAVLQEMKLLVREAADKHVALDCEPFKLMLRYIREFPEALHHPKEDNYLFAKLRQRTNKFDDVLAELSGHHAAGEQWLQRLESELARFESGSPDAFGVFQQAVEEFCEAQWQHMRLEEGVVLPAASAHLSPQDWEEIAEAFGTNGDPRFGAAPDKTYRNMFAKIARLVPEGGSARH